MEVKYITNLHLYIDGIGYIYSLCDRVENGRKQNLLYTILTSIFGVWLPLLLIAMINILMYIKLRRQAKQMQSTSSQDSNAQINTLSRTFTIILVALYVCYLPFTIQIVINGYVEYTSKAAVLKHIHPFSHFLWFCNSAVNPIIYSKVHVKIWNLVKRFIGTYKEKCNIKTNLNCFKKSRSNIPSGFSTQNAGEVSHRKNENEDDISEGHTTISSSRNCKSSSLAQNAIENPEIMAIEDVQDTTL